MAEAAKDPGQWQEKYNALLLEKQKIETVINGCGNDFFLLYGPVSKKQKVEREIEELLKKRH